MDLIFALVGSGVVVMLLPAIVVAIRPGNEPSRSTSP